MLLLEEILQQEKPVDNAPQNQKATHLAVSRSLCGSVQSLQHTY